MIRQIFDNDFFILFAFNFFSFRSNFTKIKEKSSWSGNKRSIFAHFYFQRPRRDFYFLNIKIKLSKINPSLIKNQDRTFYIFLPQPLNLFAQALSIKNPLKTPTPTSQKIKIKIKIKHPTPPLPLHSHLQLKLYKPSITKQINIYLIKRL